MSVVLIREVTSLGFLDVEAPETAAGRKKKVLFHSFFGKSVEYRGADKSLARPTSRYILFNGENISFDASLVIYINSTNILPIIIINRIYERKNLLSL